MKRTLFTLAILAAVSASSAFAALPSPEPLERPDAMIDLRTNEGAAAVKGQWRYHDAQIIDAENRLPGPEKKPTGNVVKTHDISPKAGAPDFDDSGWEKIAADSLETRRTAGKLAAGWFRLNITLPEKVGKFDVAGTTAVLELVLDDYAEISVNGKLPTVLGQAGGQLIKGWNAPNRVVLTTNAKPGETIQLAILGVNGPISDPPSNYIWVRSATIDFYKPGRIYSPEQVAVKIERLDSALDKVIPADAKLEKLAQGFKFTEGPVWHPEGYLLFSDPNNNTIYRWNPPGALWVYRTKSGYTGPDIGEYNQPGSNGLTLDREGRLTICEHGNRRITRLEKNGTITVLADKFEGKRLNSPNDLVYRSDGALYFTDPPFGLPKFGDDPRKELDFAGVFCLIGGKLKVVSKDFAGPNGLAFSPDEKFLYVCNWDNAKKIVMKYAVAANGDLSDGKVFYDMTSAPGEEALDGLKVDKLGNVYVSGPGGVWILSPEGKQIGKIAGSELPANFAFGDDDGKTLYMAARTGIYRMRLNVEGIRPAASQTLTVEARK